MVGIADVGEIQSVWRADGTAGPAVAGRKGGADVIRFPCTASDSFERADKTANLIVQKGPGADVDVEKLAVGARDFFDPEFVECAHRAVSLTKRRAECCEIVPTQQVIRTGLHCGGVQRVLYTPHTTGIQHQGRAAGSKFEKIAPLCRGKAGVPVVRDLRAGDNGNGRGFKVKVQRLCQAERFPVTGQVAMRHLSRRVNARIRAAGGGDCMRSGFQLRQCRLDRGLNRWLIGLPLPPGKWRAIVFDFKCIAGHCAGLGLRRP